MKIHYHTVALFTAFILIAVVGSIFIYVYQSKVDAFVAAYAAKIVICGNISDETQCNGQSECQAIYGPIAPDSSELEFKRCQRLPLQVIAETIQQNQICQQTGGQWYRNKLGTFCLCQKAGSNKIFDKTRGCIIP